MDGAETTPLLQAPTLHRRASRRTLATTKRTSPRFLRRLLTRTKSIFVRSRPATPAGIEHFSRLPAEIRIRIYAHILRFDAPLKLLPAAARCRAKAQRLRNLDVLRVSRLIHIEALAALYDTNIISAPRAAFCTVTRPTRDSVNHDLVRALEVPSLAPSLACSTRVFSLGPCDPPCVHCEGDLLPFLRTLSAMPRLREVRVDYHGYAGVVAKLATSLEGPVGRDTGLRLVCKGIGMYVLEGSWVGGKRVELRDELLSEVWTIYTSMPKARLGSVVGTMRLWRVRQKAMFEALSPRFGNREVKRTAHQVNRVVQWHNSGLVSKTTSEIWPADLEMDFAVLEGCGRGAFLHAFNVELQRLCAEASTTDMFCDCTFRRGHQEQHSLSAMLGPGLDGDGDF